MIGLKALKRLSISSEQSVNEDDSGRKVLPPEEKTPTSIRRNSFQSNSSTRNLSGFLLSERDSEVNSDPVCE